LIDVSDLKEMYSNLGAAPQDSVLQAMIKEAPQLNFTGFLNIFSEKMSGTDPEDTLRNAFAMFDSDNVGYIPEEYMKDLLQNMGDNFTADEIRQTWKEAPISGGKFEYPAFVKKLKGKEEDQA
jgi:Ca2+-binding EF-hand superfamily protein